MPANFEAIELNDQLSDFTAQEFAKYLGTLGMAVGVNIAALPPMVKAPTLLAARQGETIALGLREGLDDFAKSVGGSTWKQWASANPDRWRSAFLDVVSNPANKLKFNLTGVDDPWRAVTRAASGRGGATD